MVLDSELAFCYPKISCPSLRIYTTLCVPIAARKFSSTSSFMFFQIILRNFAHYQFPLPPKERMRRKSVSLLYNSWIKSLHALRLVAVCIYKSYYLLCGNFIFSYISKIPYQFNTFSGDSRVFLKTNLNFHPPFPFLLSFFFSLSFLLFSVKHVD